MYKEKLKELVDSGALQLWLQPSAPRTGSNFLARMVNQSAKIDHVASFCMNLNYDDAEDYAKHLVQAYDELAEKKGTPVRLYLKEHAAFLGDNTWNLLKQHVKGTVFIVRDPLLQSMSELTSISDDADYMKVALESRGHPNVDIESKLEAYAESKGFSADGEKPAYKQLTGEVKKTGNYLLLEGLMNECYGTPVNVHFESNNTHRKANAPAFGKDSYSRMAELVRDANPENSIVINATAIQGNPRIAIPLCQKLGIAFDRRMTEGKWAALNDSYNLSFIPGKRDAWAASGNDEVSIIPPYKEAVKAEFLPEVSRECIPEKLRSYLLLLNSQLCIAPQTTEQFMRFFNKRIDVQRAGVISGSLMEKNPVACYAMVSASRTLPDNDRNELKEVIAETCPKFIEAFTEIDSLCKELEQQLVHNAPQTRLYRDGATGFSGGNTSTPVIGGSLW